MNDEELKIHDAAVAFAKAHKRTRCVQLTDKTRYVPEEHPVSVFMAGSPGAGKTEAAKEIIAQLQRFCVSIRTIFAASFRGTTDRTPGCFSAPRLRGSTECMTWP